MPAVAMPHGAEPAAPAAAPFVPNRQVDQQLDKAAADAVRRLNEVSPQGLPSAEPAASASELDHYNAEQRKIRELDLLNKKADAVKKLYQTMYGKDVDIGQPPPGATESRKPTGVSEEEVRRRVEEARQQALKEADELRSRKEADELALGPRPVVAQIIGAGKNRQAVVMLPCDRGSVTVKVGSRLTQGDDPMRVAAISEEGVEVTMKGNRFFLGFGNVSSKCGTGGAPKQAASAPVGYPVPVMGGPLQISGAGRMR
jgi:hypothetical protein